MLLVTISVQNVITEMNVYNVLKEDFSNQIVNAQKEHLMLELLNVKFVNLHASLVMA